jgi:hypothetical protein
MPISPLGVKPFDGHVRISQVVFTGPASYTSNGEVATARDFGLDTILPGATLTGVNASGVVTHLAYITVGVDKGANSTLEGIRDCKVWINTIAGVAAAGSADLSGVTFKGVVFGH